MRLRVLRQAYFEKQRNDSVGEAGREGYVVDQSRSSHPPERGPEFSPHLQVFLAPHACGCEW